MAAHGAVCTQEVSHGVQGQSAAHVAVAHTTPAYIAHAKIGYDVQDMRWQDNKNSRRLRKQIFCSRDINC